MYTPAQFGVGEGARPRASKCYKDTKRVEAPAGFKCLRVHDLRHTFGRRLGATSVSLEDREDLLGHKCDRVTTDYSAPEIRNLIQAANQGDQVSKFS